jgi:hypothetical protein
VNSESPSHRKHDIHGSEEDVLQVGGGSLLEEDVLQVGGGSLLEDAEWYERHVLAYLAADSALLGGSGKNWYLMVVGAGKQMLGSEVVEEDVLGKGGEEHSWQALKVADMDLPHSSN